jgi:hypothetical protein
MSNQLQGNVMPDQTTAWMLKLWGAWRGYCACLRRELSGEPDAGSLHLRFDEGRVGRAMVSPSLLLYRSSLSVARPKLALDTAGFLMSVADDMATYTDSFASTGVYPGAVDGYHVSRAAKR